MSLEDYRCPLCGKPLAGEEYRRAVEQLKVIAKQEYNAQTEKDKVELQRKLEEIEQKHRQETDDLKQTFEKQAGELNLSHAQEIKSIRKLNEEQTRSLLNELKSTYEQRMTQLQQEYSALSSQSKTQFDSLVTQMRKSQKTELQARVKEIAALRKELLSAKRLAKEEGRSEVQGSVDKVRKQLEEKNLQIERANKKIEELQGQLTQSQAERIGEVGERDLYSRLLKAFEDDRFERQKRGAESGDIIQWVKPRGEKPLAHPIVYDNKEAKTITKKDLEKAKKYRSQHNTNYVIIVSQSLPRAVKNHYYGEEDGILMVHSSIAVQVARQIRTAMIEIDRVSESTRDRTRKEEKLYEYIRGQEFTRTIENLHEVNQQMVELQGREERAHQRLWKDRKAIQADINRIYMEISSDIGSIIQEKPAMEELSRALPRVHRK